MAPGVFDVDNSLGKLDLKDIVQSVVQEGCIEETLAAIEAHFREHVAQDSGVKTTLKEIADDETRHAKLAWDTIYWITKKYPEYESFVETTLHDQLERAKAISFEKIPTSPSDLCTDYGKDDYFKKFGILASDDRDKVRRFGIEEIIKPTLESGTDHFGS